MDRTLLRKTKDKKASDLTKRKSSAFSTGNPNAHNRPASVDDADSDQMYLLPVVTVSAPRPPGAPKSDTYDVSRRARSRRCNSWCVGNAVTVLSSTEDRSNAGGLRSSSALSFENTLDELSAMFDCQTSVGVNIGDNQRSQLTSSELVSETAHAASTAENAAAAGAVTAAAAPVFSDRLKTKSNKRNYMY